MKKTNAFLPESFRACSRQSGSVAGPTVTSTPRSPLDSELKAKAEHSKLAAEEVLEGKSQQSPAQLFTMLSVAEKAANHSSLVPFKNAITKTLLFRKPLFEAAPVINLCSPLPAGIDLAIRTQLWQGQKYRKILTYLAQSRVREGRLLVIAGWLEGEGVCQAEDILGEERFHRLVKKTCGRISDADFRRADQVRTWLPYFSRLLQDLRGQNSAKLVELGYRHEAVLSCRGKRSAVEAACDWLASRPGCEGIDAPTFRNAYSRIYGPKRRRSPATARSGAPAKFHKKKK